MNAPHQDVPRLLECGVAIKLAQQSPLAMRVFLHLFWGEDSEKPGFGRCSPSLLADTLGSSKRAIVAALDELQSNELIVWSADERLAYRPGFALRFKPIQPANVNNWHDTAARLRDGLVAAQVRKDIGPRLELGKASSSEPSKQLSTELGKGYLSVSSVSSVSSVVEPQSATQTPAATAPAVDLFGQQAKPKRTAKPKEAKEPKPINPTFEKALQVAALWNELLPDQPKAAADGKNMRVLAKALDTYGEGMLRSVMAWAQTNDWHSGRKKAKAIAWWMASDSLAAVVKDYENREKGSAYTGKRERGMDDWRTENDGYQILKIRKDV